MKYLVAILLLAIAASTATASPRTLGAARPSADSVVVAGTPFIDDAEGEDFAFYPFNVTVSSPSSLTGRGSAPRTVQYQVTDLVKNFATAYAHCSKKGLRLASPKTWEEQEALKALLARLDFSTNAWLAAECLDEGWAWLDDDSFIGYNNFPIGSQNYEPCQERREALIINTPNLNNRPGAWFMWAVGDTTEDYHVICQV